MIVGRYCIYGQLAKGGSSTVHLARLLGPIGFSRVVAIKRPHLHLTADPEFVAMFVDEARLAARVRHPNAVATLDVVVSQSLLFLVLEYVHGESLSHLLRAVAGGGARAPAPIGAAVVVGALQGLHAMHEARDESGNPLSIVHRDVAPQNILVGVDGSARIIDFGVAQAAGRLQQTRPGLLKGRLAYMAPERLRGARATRQLDIFSAGVVLWESLAGARLFPSEEPAATTRQILDGRIPPVRAVAPEVPEALGRVVARALSSDPAARFESAHAMAIAIQEAIPIATADQVAQWVVTSAAPSLAARAGLIAAAEANERPRSGLWRAARAQGAEDVSAGDATQTSLPGPVAAPEAPSTAPAAVPEVGPEPPVLVGCHPPEGQHAVPVARVRSTLLCAGLAALRALGHFDRYLEQLDRTMREWALTLVPAAWVPAARAEQHFAACDALGLGEEGAFTIGVYSGERAHGPVFKTLEDLRVGGAPMPWPLLAHYGPLWTRMFEGGGLRVTRLGPRHAEIALSRVPFARSPYFRHAFRGTNFAGLRRGAPGARVFELAQSVSDSGFIVHAMW